jgi:hypothetical protein
MILGLVSIVEQRIVMYAIVYDHIRFGLEISDSQQTRWRSHCRYRSAAPESNLPGKVSGMQLQSSLRRGGLN